MLCRGVHRSCRPFGTRCPGVHVSANSRCSSRRTVAARSVGTQQATPPGLAPLPWDGTPEQQQALSQLQSRFASTSAGDVPDEETFKWYLRDRYFDVEEAEQKLRASLAWRQALRVDQLTQADVAAEFATGKSYVHSQPDKYGRPVLIIESSKHNTGEFSINDSKRLCTFLLEQALAQRPPGVEQIAAVVDLQRMRLSNIDFPFIAFMVDAFFVYYPRRMGQVLLVDAPWIFKAPWEAIKPLLRKYSALVRFVSRRELADEFFAPDTLPPVFKN